MSRHSITVDTPPRFHAWQVIFRNAYSPDSTLWWRLVTGHVHAHNEANPVPARKLIDALWIEPAGIVP